MKKIAQPHVETSNHHYIDLHIENIPMKERIGYLEDFINDIFDIDGYYFNDLNDEDKNRIFNYYEKSRMNKIKQIKSLLIKTNLLLSSGFMSMVRRGGEVWESLLREYRQLEQKGYNEKQITKHWSNKYNFNEFDVAYIKHESNLPTEVEQPKVEEIQPQKEEVTQEVVEEPKVENRTEEDAPYYETEFIEVRKLDKGDVLYLEDDWWVVFKKSRIKIWVQNLWDKKIKTIRKEPTDKVEILTDESVSQIINEFKDENLEDNLPDTLKK